MQSKLSNLSPGDLEPRAATGQSGERGGGGGEQVDRSGGRTGGRKRRGERGFSGVWRG